MADVLVTSARTEAPYKGTSYLFYLLLSVSFLHGIFASGFIPILHQELEKGAGVAFSVYFLGLLLGQLVIFRFRSFSSKRWHFGLYEVLFGGSLVVMGIFASPMMLTVGRGLEGLVGGFATPLLFAQLVNAPCDLPAEKKIVRYNATFALGFVLGPVIVEVLIKWIDSYRPCLIILGSVFMLLSAFLAFKLPELKQENDEDLRLSKLFAGETWFEKFYSLFYSKSFYGFLLSFLTAYATVFFGKMPIFVLTLAMAVVFVVGQQVASRTVHYFNTLTLEIILPISVGLAVVVFWYTHWPGMFFVSAFLHAYLLFIALLHFTKHIESGREFALFNSMSDPGMVLGATLAYYGLNAAFVLVALSFLPLLYYRRLPALLKKDS